MIREAHTRLQTLFSSNPVSINRCGGLVFKTNPLLGRLTILETRLDRFQSGRDALGHSRTLEGTDCLYHCLCFISASDKAVTLMQ